MTGRTTLAMAKSARIAEAINISVSDPRFLSYLNAATQRILIRGKFFGTYGRYAVSVNSQFLTLPPAIDTIEKAAVSTTPLPVRDQWFEFLATGWGTRDRTLPNGSGVPEVLQNGFYPTIIDVISPGGALTVKCDRSTDVGKTVLILGYDTNGNWVRTLQGGIYLDGEVVALAQGAGTNTVTLFSSVTGIQAPSTLDGQWWLYQGGIAGTMIGNYQYWETSPSYPRYMIPFINTTVTTVEVMGKKAFYPVKYDTDYLVIGNLPALKLACMAIVAEEDHNFVEASILWNGGTDKKTGQQVIGVLQEMNFELQHFLGDGREVGMEIKGLNIGEVEPIPVIV